MPAVGGQQDRGRLAAGRVDDDHRQVGRRRPGGPHRLERRERVAQVGGHADVAEPELGDPLDRLRVDVDGDERRRPPRVAGRGQRQLAGVPGAEHADGARRRREVARLRAGGADVVDLERVAERQVVGHRRPAGALEDVRGPVDLDLGGVGIEAGDRVEPQRGQRQRAERRDPRRRSRGGSREALADRGRRCRAGCRPSRSRGCASCRARRRSRGSARPSARGRLAARSRRLRKRGRVEAQPLDRDLELVRADRARRLEALGRLRQRPAAASSTRSAPSRSLISSAIPVFMNDR